ncbi:MAG: hypothetical protein OXE98_06585, partial [Hyphomicrobiales bacterium]|nr:hypothetical protein [Hyphomicrobiales bacterium]
MNMIRTIAIALPMTLLLACGGGGSSNTAATMNPPSFQPIENSPTREDVEETALIDDVRDNMELLYSDVYEAGNMDKTDVSSCTVGCVIPVPLVSAGVATAIIPSGTGASLPDL